MAKQADLPIDKADGEAQLREAQKTLSFDIKEYPIETHVTKFLEGDYRIREYQRSFVWSEAKQSKFVESVLIGIPVPFMFGVEEEVIEGQISIIDGVQRLNTLRNFLEDRLRLTELEKLDSLDGFAFSDLSILQQRRLRHRTIRIIVISSADALTQFDLFERINTTPEIPEFAEVRRGAFPGPITDLRIACAQDDRFINLTPLGEDRVARRRREELALRLFAYRFRYKQFRHDVRRFLDSYLEETNHLAVADPAVTDRHRAVFKSVVLFAEENFPRGFASPSRNTTPNVRFEALAVGVALALAEQPDLRPRSLKLDGRSQRKNLKNSLALMQATRVPGYAHGSNSSATSFWAKS
jgi:Protein of unknown function DUF262